MSGDYKRMLEYIHWRANPETYLDEVKPEDARAFLDVMEERLMIAADDIDRWGTYASGYIQVRDNLDGDVDVVRRWADEMKRK